MTRQHRDDYDDENDFHAELFDASWTAGQILAVLSRCGLRPEDLAPLLPEHLHPRWWGGGIGQIPGEVVELAFRADGVRRELVDAIVARHRHSRQRVILTVHRTDADARRYAIVNDAGRALSTDLAVPGLAALQRAAAAEAVDRLVALGVFATIELTDDPMRGGDLSKPVGRDPDWTPPDPGHSGDDCPFD
jgi:hypothetical protein